MEREWWVKCEAVGGKRVLFQQRKNFRAITHDLDRFDIRPAVGVFRVNIFDVERKAYPGRWQSQSAIGLTLNVAKTFLCLKVKLSILFSTFPWF
jgi:hypothetical protein